MRRLPFLILVWLITLPSGAFGAEKYELLTRTEPDGHPPAAYPGLIDTKEAAPGDTTWIRVYDPFDTSCDATFSGGSGGQGVGLAPGYATWCWEGGDLGGGIFDSCSHTFSYGFALPGCFTHYDVSVGRLNRWHLNTFQAFNEGGGGPDSSPWCGEFGDTLVWCNPNGYGPHYNYSLILDLGTVGSTGFNASAGFTIGGVHMYDVELNYDYCYLEYALDNNPAAATWFELERFSGTSNPLVGCIDASGGASYGCARYEALAAIGPPSDNSFDRLLVRWRFASDGAWDDDDAAGGVHTDGAWRIDHISARSVAPGMNYPFGGGPYDDFESGFNAQWSFPTYPEASIGGFWSGGVWVNGLPVPADWWHLELDPSYVNYGGTYHYSNTWMWTADDPNHSQNQEDRYHYRLVSPVFDTGVNNPYTPGMAWTGVLIESDEYFCLNSIVGDVIDTRTRVHNSNTNRWSPFTGDEYVLNGGCTFWEIDKVRDWSSDLTANTDSIQFSWDFLDRCDYNSSLELPCMGQHRKATWLVDNISIGIYVRNSTRWSLASPDKFQDTFARDIDMHSARKENFELHPADSWEGEDSLAILLSDYDGLKKDGIKIHWRISTSCGQTWDLDNGRPLGSNDFPAVPYNAKTMNFSVPNSKPAEGTKGEYDGTYRTRITIEENLPYLGGGATLWPEGTVIEYFFSAEDSGGNIDTFPNRLSLSRTSPKLINSSAGYDRRLEWPFEVSVLPCPARQLKRAAGQEGNILLVNSYPYRVYDLESDTEGDQEGIIDFPKTRQVYEESLDRLGLVYDRYDNNGAGMEIYSQPTDADGYGGILDHQLQDPVRRYDAVIWFTGSFNQYTVLDSSQLEITSFLDTLMDDVSGNGLFWLLGDNLCEDEALSDPAWTDGSGNQTTNSAYFWSVLADLNPVPGGCTDGDGVDLPAYYFRGEPGGDFATITNAVANQISGTTENDPKMQDTKPIARKSDELTPHGGGPGTVQGTAQPTAEQIATASQIGTVGTLLRMHTLCLALMLTGNTRDCMMYYAMYGIITFPSFTPPAGCNIDEVDVEPPLPALTELRLGPAHPNPFNPVVILPFALPETGMVDFAIYDVRGRLVKSLITGIRTGGMYVGDSAVTWDGQSDDNRQMPSGVYFAKLESAGESSTAKVVLLR